MVQRWVFFFFTGIFSWIQWVFLLFIFYCWFPLYSKYLCIFLVLFFRLSHFLLPSSKFRVWLSMFLARLRVHAQVLVFFFQLIKLSVTWRWAKQVSPSSSAVSQELERRRVPSTSFAIWQRTGEPTAGLLSSASWSVSGPFCFWMTYRSPTCFPVSVLVILVLWLSSTKYGFVMKDCLLPIILGVVLESVDCRCPHPPPPSCYILREGICYCIELKTSYVTSCGIGQKVVTWWLVTWPRVTVWDQGSHASRRLHTCWTWLTLRLLCVSWNQCSQSKDLTEKQ